MRPVHINDDDDHKVLIEKVNIVLDDVYRKFGSINDNIYDFVAEDGIPQNTFATIDSVDSLNQTIGASPSQAEVQAISDKLDELLTGLRKANIITT